MNWFKIKSWRSWKGWTHLRNKFLTHGNTINSQIPSVLYVQAWYELSRDSLEEFLPFNLSLFRPSISQSVVYSVKKSYPLSDAQIKTETSFSRIIFPSLWSVKMSPVEVYGMKGSAPCHIVSMALEMTKTEYEFKVVNLMAGDHMKPEYIKVHLCLPASSVNTGLE